MVNNCSPGTKKLIQRDPLTTADSQQLFETEDDVSNVKTCLQT